MSVFSRILFPLNGNEKALDYAISLAKPDDAKLFLLHTYRLTDMKDKVSSNGNKSVIGQIDERFHDKFNKTYLKKLEASGLEFELMVEVGFLVDRIVANIKEKSIDMLLLEGLNANDDDTLVEHLPSLTVPVMLIPETQISVPVS